MEYWSTGRILNMTTNEVVTAIFYKLKIKDAYKAMLTNAFNQSKLYTPYFREKIIDLRMKFKDDTFVTKFEKLILMNNSNNNANTAMHHVQQVQPPQEKVHKAQPIPVAGGSSKRKAVKQQK